MNTTALPPYVVLDKAVGETPLVCAETWRTSAGIAADVPLAYAGRLDPMASGKLLILVGEECKNQTSYHGLDKAYDFSVLLGIGSDTHDILGRLNTDQTQPSDAAVLATEEGKTWPSGPERPDQELEQLKERLLAVCFDLTGNIELPYPHFSSKTVRGKALHTWTLEGRLDEITIPTKESTIYNLESREIETKTREQVCTEARSKIDTIPPVTEASKAIGNDFRRVDVRADWERVLRDQSLPTHYHIAHFHCISSSGTYMRTLAHIIGQKLHTQGLAWHIHRTDMGTYDSTTHTWTKSF